MKDLSAGIRGRLLLFVLVTAVLCLSIENSAAQQQAPPQFPGSEINISNIPPSPIEQAEKDGTAVHISLKELTRLALQNNLNIAISDTNEQLYQQKILQSYGPYDPAISWTLGARSTTQPNTNQTNISTQGTSNNMELDTWNFQFTQNLPTGGGIVASVNSNRSDTNQLFALFSPQYNATSSIQITQPLLRNRQIDQNRGTIKLANLDLKINDSQFKQTIVNTIASVQGTYWDLVSAIRQYDIDVESIKLAQITVDQNREKVRIGVLAPIEITVAQAAVASRLVDLVTAAQNIKVAENTLRSTISSDRNSEIWQQVIVPSNSADFVEYKVDLQSAIDTALKNRPELEQYNFQMQENAINYAVDQNQKKWQLDAVGSFGTVGVAGPQAMSPLTGQPVIPAALVGGVGTAYSTMFTQGFKNWFVGFNVQIPLRNRSLEGQLGQLQVQKRQLEMNIRSTEQNIALQIRNSVDDLESNRQKVQAATVARKLAEVQLDAETKRFKAGTSQNFLVLQRQNDLSTAQGAELQALVAYKKSIITLQQNMYTLLEANDFEIAGAGSKNSAVNKFH